MTTEERQSALVVSIWQGETWIMPWAQFVSARLDSEVLELSFTNAVVTLAGQNLAALSGDIAAFRLAYLRDLPPDYRRKPIEGQPFISGIEVRSFRPEARDSPG